jgi:leucyl aminopeptidase
MTELDSVGLVGIVARRDEGEFVISDGVPDEVVGISLPKSYGSEWAKRQGLSDAIASTTVLRSLGETNVALVSGGAEATNSLDEWRRIAAALVRAADSESIAFLLPVSDVTDAASVAQALSEGAVLSSYAYGDAASTDAEPLEFVIVPVGSMPTVDFHDALAAGVATGTVIADSANWAKELINTPAGSLPPKELAKRISRRLDDDEHVTITSWSEPKIESERLGGLLGVAQGSAQPPRLVYATYDPDPGSELTHVCLVGKGITFDAGGLSIKTADGMMTMKTDMSGSAIVSAVLSAASRLGLRVKVTAIAPMTENLLGARAMKPGDVLTIRNGTTVEVLNTDAEGRLVLADGLSLAVEAEPDAIIDVATLTGAQAVALGDEIAAIFSSDDDLASDLMAASDVSGESMCRLPLHEGYESHIDSDIADIKNMGKPGRAGAIAAALFLGRFVGDVPWAHFDIAGPARSDAVRGYYAKGATAYAARTIIEYLRQLHTEAPDPIGAGGNGPVE